MKKKSSTINKNKIKKTKRKIKIKISNIAIQVTYLIILNEFLYQNKFVIETNTHIKFIEQQLKKKMQGYIYEKSYKKSIFKNKTNLIYIKLRKNHK
jgi:hypothetical protein